MHTVAAGARPAKINRASNSMNATASPSAVDGISSDLTALIADVKRRDGLVDEHHRQVVDKAVGSAALGAAIDQNNVLNDAYASALDAVAEHPVSTVADLVTKLTFMIENHMGDGRDWLEQINADVLRIAVAEDR